MEKKLSFKEIFFIGLMIFSLFFGAGNLIFPAELGAKAGESVFSAMGGFLLRALAYRRLAYYRLLLSVKKVNLKISPSRYIQFLPYY